MHIIKCTHLWVVGLRSVLCEHDCQKLLNLTVDNSAIKTEQNFVTCALMSFLITLKKNYSHIVKIHENSHLNVRKSHVIC